MTTDTIQWNAHAHVDKFDEDQVKFVRGKTGLLEPKAADFIQLGIDPSDSIDKPGNLLTTAGLTRLVSLLNGAGGQALTNTATRIGTGNGGGSAAVGDTALSASAGAANQWWQIMDATFPSASGAVLTAKSTFGTADGNYVWAEWAIDVGTPTVSSSAVVSATGPMMNHKTAAALGTKASGSIWAFTVTVTFS